MIILRLTTRLSVITIFSLLYWLYSMLLSPNNILEKIKNKQISKDSSKKTIDFKYINAIINR